MSSDASATRLGTAERLWRRVLLDPNARAAPFVIDVSGRPAEAPMVRRRPLERSRIGALVALFVIASLFMINAVFEGLVGMGLIAGFLLCLVGIIFVIVVAASRMEWHASWLAEGVRVRDRRWGKTREWSAPYAEFEGVAVRKLRIGKSNFTGVRLPVTYHLAELRHRDPLKTILLASSRDPAKSEEAAQTAATALGLARV